MKFMPTRIDPHVYMRNNFNANSQPYWEYLLVYVGDVLALSTNLEPMMKQIRERFEIKNNDYGPPKLYLGTEGEKFNIPNSPISARSMYSKKYVESAGNTSRDLY